MCTICNHPLRSDIDRAILAQDGVRDIGTRFGTSKSEVDRHKNICMKRTFSALPAPLQVPVYQTPAEVAIASQNVRSVAQRAAQLVDKMESLAVLFEEEGDTHGILKAAKEIREGLRLLAQLSGELSPGNTAVQVTVGAPSLTSSPEWRVFVRVIERHPEIREELSRELQEAGL